LPFSTWSRRCQDADWVPKIGPRVPGTGPGDPIAATKRGESGWVPGTDPGNPGTGPGDPVGATRRDESGVARKVRIFRWDTK